MQLKRGSSHEYLTQCCRILFPSTHASNFKTVLSNISEKSNSVYCFVVFFFKSCCCFVKEALISESLFPFWHVKIWSVLLSISQECVLAPCGRSVFQTSRCSCFGSICIGVFCGGIPTNHFLFNQTVPMCLSQVRTYLCKSRLKKKLSLKCLMAFPSILAISNLLSVPSQINKILL